MADLKLKVLLSAVDKITGPLRSMRGAAGNAATEVRNTQGRIRELNNQAKQIDGYVAVKRQLQDVGGQLSTAQQRAQRLGAEMARTQNPTKQMAREFDNAKREVVRLRGEKERLTQQQRNAQSALRETGVNTRNLSQHQRDLKRELSETNRTLENQKRQLERVNDQQRRLNQANASYQRAKEIQGRLAGTGAMAAGAGTGALYAASRLLQPGIEYGKQASELQAITRLSKDSDELKLLLNQARQLGASTAFSATEVAAGQTFLARAGFSPKAIENAMGDMLNMAIANGTDLARTADIASNIAGAFKIDPEVEGNMRRVGDVLSGTAARANVDLEMLGETMKYLGGAEDLNFTMEQAAVMAGLMGNIGIQGSQAGTTLRAMLNRLTNPVGKAAEAIEEIGLEVMDANGNMRDLPDIIRDISNATQHMGNVQRKQILQQIFGAEAGSGMTEIVNAMADGEFDELLDQMYDVYGENERMAKIMADNIAGDLNGLKSAWAEVGVSMTETNEGPLRELIRTVTGLVQGIGGWMKENEGLVRSFSKMFFYISAAAAVGGTFAVMIAGLIGPIAAIKWAITVLSIKSLPALVVGLKAATLGAAKFGLALMATPLGWIIAAVAAAAYLIYKNWDFVKNVTISIWGAISAFMTEFFTDLYSAFTGGFGAIGTFLTNWNPIGILYRGLAPMINLLGVELPATFSQFGAQMLDGLIEGFKNKFPNVHEMITNLTENIKGWFKGFLGINSPSRVFAEFGGFTMDGFISGIKGKLGAAREAIGDIGDSVVGWFKSRLGINSPSKVFAQLGGYTMDGLQQGLKNNQDSPLKQVGDLGKKLAATALAVSATVSTGVFAEGSALSAGPSTGTVVSQDYSVNIAPGAIVITGTESASTEQIAIAVRREIERMQRNQAARNRSYLGDLE